MDKGLTVRRDFFKKSTMTTILGRMAINQGTVVKPEDAVKSDLNLSPEEFSWWAKMPNTPDETGNCRIPIPGKTKVL